MTRWLWLGLFVGGVASIVSGIYCRLRWLAKDAAAVDALIDQNAAKPLYEGHDDELRKRTEARREHAESIKRDARQIETKDDRVSRIHRAS